MKTAPQKRNAAFKNRFAATDGVSFRTRYLATQNPDINRRFCRPAHVSEVIPLIEETFGTRSEGKEEQS